MYVITWVGDSLIKEKVTNSLKVVEEDTNHMKVVEMVGV
jgi:hypothetical protein